MQNRKIGKSQNREKKNANALVRQKSFLNEAPGATCTKVFILRLCPLGTIKNIKFYVHTKFTVFPKFENLLTH